MLLAIVCMIVMLIGIVMIGYTLIGMFNEYVELEEENEALRDENTELRNKLSELEEYVLISWN